jgi:hypothetical protein
LGAAEACGWDSGRVVRFVGVGPAKPALCGHRGADGKRGWSLPLPWAELLTAI